MVVCATGPSLTAACARLLGMARARDLLRIVAVNDAVYPCAFADVIYAADAQWWRHHRGVPWFRGRKVRIATCGARGEDTNDPGFSDVEAVPRCGSAGYDPASPGITTAGSGGGQALQVVAKAGAEYVVLVGFDGTSDHFFGGHPPGIRHRDPDLRQREEQMVVLAADLARAGVRVASASAASNAVFPRVDLATEVAKL